MSEFSLTLRLTRSGASWSDANDAHTEAFSEGGAYDSVGLSMYEMIDTQISEGKLTRSLSLENPAVLKIDFTWADDEDFKKYLQYSKIKRTLKNLTEINHPI